MLGTMNETITACPECGETDPAAFKTDRRMIHCVGWCKACTWAWRDDAPARVNRNSAAKRAAEYKAVFDHYGRQCACCGSGERLVIDHVHGDGAEHLAEIGSTNLHRWLIAQGFPNGGRFQVLCVPCNGSKRSFGRCSLIHFPDGSYRRLTPAERKLAGLIHPYGNPKPKG